MQGEQTGGAAVTAEGLRLEGPRGTVFEDVSLRAEPGSLIVVDGPPGSGRTALLLTLTGRMRPNGGTAEVADHGLPRRAAAVRRITALGPVPGVSDLEPSQSVAEQLRERALLLQRYDEPLRSLLRSPRRRAADVRDRREAALTAAGLAPDSLPKGHGTPVRELARQDEFRLGVALALLGRPRLLAVDDVGLKLPGAEVTAAWSLLASVAASGTTVLAVGAPPDDPPADVPLVTVSTRPQVREDV